MIMNNMRKCVLREQRHLPLVWALTYRLRDALAAANGKSKFYWWGFLLVGFYCRDIGFDFSCVR